MSEQSPSTPPETTVATSETTSLTLPTSLTTPPTPETPSSQEPTEKSALNTEAKEEPKVETKPAVPEKYEDFKLPEGMTADAKTMEEAKGFFKELGLSQDQAQKLIDYDVKRQSALTANGLQAVKDMRAGWLKSVRENPKFANEFGADGKIKPDSKTLVGLGRLLDSLGNTKLANDFRHMMDLTGVGDHPAFFEFASIIAERLAEGSPVKGNAASPHGQSATGTAQRRSAAQEIYPNLS